MVWKKIVNKKNQISWENKKAGYQSTVYDANGWKFRYFIKGTGNIKWEGMDIQDFNSKNEAMNHAKGWMDFVERRYG